MRWTPPPRVASAIFAACWGIDNAFTTLLFVRELDLETEQMAASRALPEAGPPMWLTMKLFLALAFY